MQEARWLVPYGSDSPELMDLEDEIATLAANIEAANYRLLALLREFDQREGWGGAGLKSCAHWLAWKCGIAMGAAREKVRVAHALTNLPKISDQFRRGCLSYSVVRALTRVATAENEAYLLDIARHGTAAHVERLVRHYRQHQRVEALERENGRHAARSLRVFHDDDGSVVIRAKLTPEQGERVLRALEAVLDDAEAPPEDPEEVETLGVPLEARRADALEALATTYLSGSRGRSSGGDRYLVHVHTDLETLGADGTGAEAELGEAGCVSAETARRCACDASVVRIMADARGEPLNVGRRTRTIPPALRRALDRRDGGCRFPGCSCTRHVDAHHVQHWADGGETRLDNLVLLCRQHHRLVHEGGFSVSRASDGGYRFLRPDGSLIPPSAAGRFSGNVVDLFAGNHARHLEIDHRSIVNRWKGEPMDYHIALEALMDADDECVSAESSDGQPVQDRHQPV